MLPVGFAKYSTFWYYLYLLNLERVITVNIIAAVPLNRSKSKFSMFILLRSIFQII